MIYGTLGVAWAGTTVTVSNPAFGIVSQSQTRPGWVAGVGGEWAAWSGPWGDLIFKLEYLHVGLRVHNFFDPATVVGVETRDLKVSDDMVRVGVNLKFNPWASPVVARY
jgi:outer membrane immunogenic protein